MKVMEIKLPSVTTATAVFNIYLILSICMVQVYATKKPIDSKKLFNESEEHTDSENVMRTMRSDPRVKTLLSVNDIIEVARVEEIGDKLVSSNNDQIKQSKISNRALDIFEEDEEFFRPSVRFESSGQQPGSRIRTVSRGNNERYGQRLRRPARNRLGDRRQSYLREDEVEDEDTLYRPRQRQRQRAGTHQDYNQYQPSQSHVRRPHGPPSHLRQQLHRQHQHLRKEGADRFPYGRPPPVSFPDYDVDEDYFNPGVDEPAKPGLLDTIFSLIKPTKPKRPETELSEPSIEWLYNDIDTEEKKLSLLIPNNRSFYSKQ